jgi:hypothetical protein
MRKFRVINENNFYFGHEGGLVYENRYDLSLRINGINPDIDLIFDKSEVEEVKNKHRGCPNCGDDCIGWVVDGEPC